MTRSSGKASVVRAGEWLAALVGAISCILVPALFAQSGADFPFPALYFIQIALLGVLVLATVVFRPRPAGRWGAIPWVAAGILLAFVVLGGFSIGFYLIPALITFALVGILIDRQSGSGVGRDIGLFVVAAVVQASVILVFVLSR